MSSQTIFLIFGFIIILFILYIYIYGENIISTLISDKLKEIPELKLNLSKEKLSELDKIQSEYESNNKIISNNYNELLAKLLILENSNTGLKEDISKELNGRFNKIRLEYDNALIDNSDILYSKIQTLIKSEIENQNLKDSLKEIISEYLVEFNKENTFLSNTFLEYKQNTEGEFSSLNKILTDYKLKNDSAIQKIISDISINSENIDKYITNNTNISIDLENINKKLLDYATNQINITKEIQDKISNLNLNIEDAKLLKSKVESIQKSIENNLDNNKGMGLLLNNISNGLGNITKLQSSYIFVKEINSLISEILGNIRGFNEGSNLSESLELISACNNYLSKYGLSNYANYLDYVDINDKLTLIKTSITSTHNSVNSTLSKRSNDAQLTKINDYLIYLINNKFRLMEISPNSSENPITISSSVIDVQKSIIDIMNTTTPLKSDLVILKTKLNSISDMIGSYPFAGSKLNLSDVLLEVDRKITDTVNKIGSETVNDTTIMNNIKDIYSKINIITKSTAELFSKTDLINDIQNQLNTISKNVGFYKGNSDNPDITSAVINLQSALNKNTGDTQIITNNLNNIKKIVGNYVVDDSHADFSTSISNLNSTVGQIQNYIGKYSTDTRYSNILDAINQLYQTTNLLKSNSGAGVISLVDVNNNLKTLEINFNKLNANLGMREDYDYTNTLAKSIRSMGESVNKLYETVGSMSYPYGNDISSSLKSINNFMGNATVLDKNLTDSIVDIKTSLNKIRSVIGEDSSGMIIFNTIKNLESNLTNYALNSNEVNQSVMNLQKDVNLFKSNNDLLLKSMNNLQTAIGDYSLISSSGGNISSTINSILKSIGNFIPVGNSSISSNLDNLNKSLESLTYNTVITNITKSSRALSSGFSSSANDLINLNYNPANIINHLNKLIDLIPNFEINKLNSIIIKKINDINDEMKLFYLKTKQTMDNGKIIYEKNLLNENSTIYNRELYLYTTMSPLILDYNNNISKLMGGSENPSIINAVNNLNSAIINYGIDIDSLKKNISVVGNYVSTEESPTITSAIKNLEKATAHIGTYSSSALNPNISMAISNLQKAIGSYTSSTNIIDSINNLNNILGKYNYTENNPDISTAIINLQKSLDISNNTTNYLSSSVEIIQRAISSFNSSIGKFISTNGSTISSSIEELQKATKYIGDYVESDENPNISIAIKNLQSNVLKLKSVNANDTFENIKLYVGKIYMRINNTSYLRGWDSNSEPLAGGIISLFSLLTEFNNLSSFYNPQYINLSINKNLVNMLKHCLYIQSANSYNYKMTYSGVYGISYDNDLLIKSIQNYLGNENNSIESTVIQIQESLKIANDDINKMKNSLDGVLDINSKAVVDMRAILPDTISSLNIIIKTYTNGLNTQAKDIQTKLTNLSLSLNNYSQNSLNTEIYNNILIVKGSLYGSFSGSYTSDLFANYSIQINKLITIFDIYLGTSDSPSITTALNTFKKNMGTYSGTASISSDLLTLSNNIVSINNNMNTLQTNINTLQTNISNAASSVSNNLTIISTIKSSPATTAMVFTSDTSYQFVLTCKNGVIANDYTTNNYTYNVNALHNPISSVLLNNYPFRCAISNLSINFPVLPSGTFSLESSEGILLNLINSYIGGMVPNLTTKTIYNPSTVNRVMEYPLNRSMAGFAFIPIINAVIDFSKRSNNSQVYCLKALVINTKNTNNISANPAQSETTKSVSIMGPSAMSGINSGITLNDPLNVSKAGLYVPQTMPVGVSFNSSYNPANALEAGSTFAYCNENSYVCGLKQQNVSGATFYSPICCSFNA